MDDCDADSNDGTADRGWGDRGIGPDLGYPFTHQIREVEVRIMSEL